MTFIILCGIIFGYLVYFLRVSGRKPRQSDVSGWWRVALVCATLSSGAVLFVLFSGREERNSTQVAWVGMQTRGGNQSLSIGGSRRGSIIGWPNGANYPEVTFTSGFNREYSDVNIRGGLGFVFYDGDCENGQEITESGVQVGKYVFHIGPDSRILISGGEKAVQFPVPKAGRRVYPLQSLFSPELAELRKTNALAARDLEEFAVNLRILSERGHVRVLAPEQESGKVHVRLPAKLEVIWSGQSQPVTVRDVDGSRLSLIFDPPWRRASPLPGNDGGGKFGGPITVEASALPGDYAFLLPLGNELSAVRETIRVADGGIGATPQVSGTFQSVLSEHKIVVGGYELSFAVVRELPSWSKEAGLFLLALVSLALGLRLAWPRFRLRTGWVLGGVCLTAWVLLNVRLMLALRYTLDPTHLDQLGFDNVAAAARALAVVPGIILVAARLRRDKAAIHDSQLQVVAKRTGKLLYGYLAFLYLVAIAETWLAQTLWANESGRFGGLHLGFSGIVIGSILVFATLWIAGRIYFLYIFDPEREFGDIVMRVLERLKYVFGVSFTERFAMEYAVRFWKRVDFALDDDEDDWVSEPPRLAQRWKGRVALAWLGTIFDRIFPLLNQPLVVLALVGFALAIVMFGLRFALESFAGGSEKLVQEIVAPFFVIWAPACLWLASRLRFRPGSLMSHSRFFWWLPWVTLVALLVFIPVVVFPAEVLRDAGGIVAACAFFWPVVGLLVAGGRPGRLSFGPVLVLILGLAGASLWYLNLEKLYLPGEALARLLIYKEGVGIQDRILNLPVLRKDAPRSVVVRQMRDGLEHTWENAAIAHEGRILGLGFGRAPVRRSNVPQHTLQADSTYSFFIVSEHGFAGGIGLLMIYSLPLILVLISARRQFDIGHGVATLVFCAFLIEALTHAAMNFNVLPYTGRDLPWLTPESFTDLAKWVLLSCLAVRAIQWRDLETDGPEEFVSFSLLSRGANNYPESGRRFGFAAGLIGLVPATLLVMVVVASWRLYSDSSLELPLQWTRLLDTVRSAAENGYIRVDPETLLIERDKKKGEIVGASMLDQEIARFNALDAESKLQGGGRQTSELANRLSRVSSADDFNQEVMDWLRELDEKDDAGVRPQLFRLQEDPRSIDESGQILVADRGYQIKPNPAFNNSTGFHEAENSAVPSVAFRDQASGSYFLAGNGFSVRVPRRVAASSEQERTVRMKETEARTLTIVEDSEPQGTVVNVRMQVSAKRGPGQFLFGQFRVGKEGLWFRPAVDSKLIERDGRGHKLQKQKAFIVHAGDKVEVASAVGSNRIVPSVSVSESAQGALIGPAWVMGKWVTVYDPSSSLPWTQSLANALPAEKDRLKDEATARLGTLSFNSALQNSAQALTLKLGRQHFDEFIRIRRSLSAGEQKRLAPLPPRAAIAVIDLSQGEILALGGWPRMSSSKRWERDANGDWSPPFDWVADRAPERIRQRYQSDRNFDRMPVGSASKPLWVTVVSQIRPGIEGRLAVRGPATENDVFGIKLGSSWSTHPLTEWAGLRTFLRVSDNRYQVRLGFLGLARPDESSPSGFEERKLSAFQSEYKESMDGGHSEWKKSPRFDDIGMQPITEDARSTSLHQIEQSPLARKFKDLFGVGSETGQIVHRRSFWTGNEEDDWKSAAEAPLSLSLEYASPEAANFEFNRIHTPREYVSVLLGGATNLWSNVDLAGEFATCLAGRPIIPHVSVMPAAFLRPGPGRATFRNPADLYAGLRDVVDGSDGTASPYLAPRAKEFLRSLGGVQYYAKTGTLGSDDEKQNNNYSRILFALTRDHFKKGLVFSIVVEHARKGTATVWLNDFLLENQEEIRRLLR